MSALLLSLLGNIKQEKGGKKKRILNVKFQLYHNIESYIHSNYIRNEDQPLLRKKAMLSRVNIHSKRKSTQATYSK